MNKILQRFHFEVCPTNLKQSIQTFSNVQRVYSIYQIAEGMKYIARIYFIELIRIQQQF